MLLTNLNEGIVKRLGIYRNGSVRADCRPCVEGVADQQRFNGRLAKSLTLEIFVHVPCGDSWTVDGQSAVAVHCACLGAVYRCVWFLCSPWALRNPFIIVFKSEEKENRGSG